MNWLRRKIKEFKDWRFLRLVQNCEKKRHRVIPIQSGSQWGKGCTLCKYYVELNRAEFRRVFGCSPKKFKDEFERKTGEKFFDVKNDKQPELSESIKNRPVN